MEEGWWPKRPGPAAVRACRRDTRVRTRMVAKGLHGCSHWCADCVRGCVHACGVRTGKCKAEKIRKGDKIWETKETDNHAKVVASQKKVLHLHIHVTHATRSGIPLWHYVQCGSRVCTLFRVILFSKFFKRSCSCVALQVCWLRCTFNHWAFNVVAMVIRADLVICFGSSCQHTRTDWGHIINVAAGQ